jgi:hypothetical protein
MRDCVWDLNGVCRDRSCFFGERWEDGGMGTEQGKGNGAQAAGREGSICEVWEQNEHRTALRATTRRLRALLGVKCVIRNQELSKGRRGCLQSAGAEWRSS